MYWYRYAIHVEDRTGKVKETYTSDEPPIIKENIMIVHQELERYVDLSCIAKIEIIDRRRMGL